MELTLARGPFQSIAVLFRYGKLVEVDHGKGFLTRYAHCSRLLCKEGQVSVIWNPAQNMFFSGGQYSCFFPARPTLSHLLFACSQEALS